MDNSIIELVKNKATVANADWAKITGATEKPLSSYYRRKDTGQELSWLAAGIAWHVLAEDQPGCIVIVTCSRDKEPMFEVVDAVFSSSPKELIEKYVRLRDRWQPDNCREPLGTLTGPEEMHERSIWEVNENYRKKKLRVTVFNPPDFNRNDKESDQTIIETTRQLSVDNRLKVTPVPVRDAMQTLELNKKNIKLTNNPTMAAVGYVLHELVVRKPWLADDQEPMLLA